MVFPGHMCLLAHVKSYYNMTVYLVSRPVSVCVNGAMFLVLASSFVRIAVIFRVFSSQKIKLDVGFEVFLS